MVSRTQSPTTRQVFNLFSGAIVLTNIWCVYRLSADVLADLEQGDGTRRIAV